MEVKYQKFEGNSKSKWEKALDFFQTSFGGIIFGTIIIGLASSIGGFVLEIIREHNEKKEIIIKINREIEYRFIQLYAQQSYFAQVDSLRGKPCDNYGESWKQWRDEVVSFKKSPSATTFLCAHQEFYNINTFALMMKLSGLLEGDEKKNIQKAAYELATNKYLPPTGKVRDCRLYKKLITDLNSNIWLSVWRQNFPSTIK